MVAIFMNRARLFRILIAFIRRVQFFDKQTYCMVFSGLEQSGASPHFSRGGEIIAQGFGFTVDFPKERNKDCISD